ncbi:ROK family transcriptional regulator [Pelagovum pacificum]|uniref:ROK family transcriptional regulator n=1 Tax=Pelagovum pacificum TaxID=2588711 RepID=UPI0018CCF1F2|nr:ROK family transcriptional regulator [Pelagovum pacificum]QQA43909.1 ROK family transcriptional regulator [Pelagovum pacificum]
MRKTGLLGANAGQTAAHNRGVVLRALHRHAPLSRTELAQQSGLTKQAIARIVERLIDEGLVIEARRRHGFRGQPPIDLEINPAGACAIGANIDRDFLTVVLVDALGRIRARHHVERYFMLPDEFLSEMRNAWSAFRRSGALNEDRLTGVGLAIPDWLAEVPVPGMPDGYDAWAEFDFRAELAKITDAPVSIDNDANSAAHYELDFGVGTRNRSFLYILVNACLGGGLVLDGSCYRGQTGLGGEIGWLPIGSGSEQVHPLGNLFSIFSLYEHLGARGIAARTPDDLLALDAEGKRAVADWIDEVADHVAEAVNDIGLILDPDAVLFGGRLPVPYLDTLIDSLRLRLESAEDTAPPVLRAAGSEDAAALGAAVMPLAETFALSVDAERLTRTPLRNMTPPLAVSFTPADT